MMSAAELVAQASAVLLDFDGPVTPLMPAPANRQAADAARAAMRHAGVKVPTRLVDSTDHLAVLRAAAECGPDVLEAVEVACIATEVSCAKNAEPTRGAHQFLRHCADDQRRVVIVSNNATEAVRAYLDRYDLDGFVVAILGRTRCRPDLMKPHTFVVDTALELLGVQASAAVLIGDTITDMEVARAVGTRAIGYAKQPERADALHDAGADAVIRSMTDLHS